MGTIIEYGVYCNKLGRYIGELNKELYRAQPEDLEEFVNLLEVHPMAKKNIAVTKMPRLFYTREPDLANDIPARKREELFYAYKLGFASPAVPAKLLYLAKYAYEEFGSPNMLFKVAFEKDLKTFFSKGYLNEEYTVRDVICSITNLQDYMALEEGRNAVKIGNHWDIYIKSEDAIAMIPEELKNILSYSDIENIELKNNKLCIGDKPICQLGRYVGAVNSVYDLRDLL